MMAGHVGLCGGTLLDQAQHLAKSALEATGKFLGEFRKNLRIVCSYILEKTFELIKLFLWHSTAKLIIQVLEMFLRVLVWRLSISKVLVLISLGNGSRLKQACVLKVLGFESTFGVGFRRFIGEVHIKKHDVSSPQ
ncbi:hypothetical protein TIFTF001_037250 [Ficus carica]|uniref:Uncharacterized protein n=1 Tax=Ficus carica TaxID=3494 RepID=A0AA88JBN4_FICCA|nr:hypothetical protein TIFTF001_037250 [Ficus carica]